MYRKRTILGQDVNAITPEYFAIADLVVAASFRMEVYAAFQWSLFTEGANFG